MNTGEQGFPYYMVDGLGASVWKPVPFAKEAVINLELPQPYSLNRVSEMVAIGALRNQDFVRKGVDLVNAERKRLEGGLSALGFKVFPSEANFILFRSPINHSMLVRKLSEKGVMIRDFGANRGLENCVRTTIGTKEMNETLLSKLEEVLRECR